MFKCPALVFTTMALPAAYLGPFIPTSGHYIEYFVIILAATDMVPAALPKLVLLTGIMRVDA